MRPAEGVCSMRRWLLETALCLLPNNQLSSMLAAKPRPQLTGQQVSSLVGMRLCWKTVQRIEHAVVQALNLGAGEGRGTSTLGSPSCLSAGCAAATKLLSNRSRCRAGWMVLVQSGCVRCFTRGGSNEMLCSPCYHVDVTCTHLKTAWSPS